ncbi:MAG TPA: PDZ domain-containing protein [Polyangiales bacterium]|nr:PDZ domain-containing protein [Polyangiales bacterium]
MLTPAELARLATALGGLPILGCLAGSPAEDAGVRYGDILLSLDGMPTSSWDEFVRARTQAGRAIVVRVFRQGQEFDLSIELRRSDKTPEQVIDELRGAASAPTNEEEPSDA